MLLYLVRHGQSYNTHPAPDQPTPANPPLTPVGLAQSQRVAERLSALGVSRLLSSPMIRAVETALVIGRALGLPVEIRPGCHEFRETPGYRCWGARALGRYYPTLVMPADFAPNDWDYGGESLAAAMARADAFLVWLEQLSGRLETRRVVVVTHGAFTRTLLGRVLGADAGAAQRIIVDNTSLTVLDFSSDGTTVLGVNDTSHLANLSTLDPALGLTR